MSDDMSDEDDRIQYKVKQMLNGLITHGKPLEDEADHLTGHMVPSGDPWEEDGRSPDEAIEHLQDIVNSAERPPDYAAYVVDYDTKETLKTDPDPYKSRTPEDPFDGTLGGIPVYVHHKAPDGKVICVTTYQMRVARALADSSEVHTVAEVILIMFGAMESEDEALGEGAPPKRAPWEIGDTLHIQEDKDGFCLDEDEHMRAMRAIYLRNMGW